MLDRKQINKTLGNASLVLRIQNIATHLAQGKPPTALQVISVCRSLLYRWPHFEKALTSMKVVVGNTFIKAKKACCTKKGSKSTSIEKK